MTILVFNCGSSSVRAALFDTHARRRLLDVHISGIGAAEGALRIGDVTDAVTVTDHAHALHQVLTALTNSGHDVSAISAVGHRVLHGGETFVAPTIIDDPVAAAIESMTSLAPLHNPASLAGIRKARAALPDCPHFAVFDTAFHATLPDCAKRYALSNEITARHGLRRFGFHGISHQFVTQTAAAALGADVGRLRIISCHLGNGCSVTAVENGQSVETSMGMTPLEGLVMGSRSGDVDPGVLMYLLRDRAMTADELDTLLNRNSGLRGMTGTNNMRDIEQRAADGDESCQRAIQVFTHRARKYIGAYAAVMGGVDAIVFTGGIGERSALVRQRIAHNFDYLGASLDDDCNRNAKPDHSERTIDISARTSRVKILVVATDEEAAIARAVECELHPGAA